MILFSSLACEKLNSSLFLEASWALVLTMPLDIPKLLLAAAAAAGPISHGLFFIHGERHLQASIYFRISLTATAVVLLTALRTDIEVTWYGFLLLGSYFFALFASIIVYRLLLLDHGVAHHRS